MLAAAQDGLIKLLKGSPLAKKLRTVDVLPTVATQLLFQHFVLNAPGIFVDVGGFSDNNKSRNVKAEMGILLIAKNARGQQQAQQGDGIMIGVIEMADIASALIDGATAGCINWTVERVAALDNFEDRPFCNSGLIAMAMKVCGKATLPPRLSPEAFAALDDFKTMAVDFDIEPFASTAVRDGWLNEPKDITGGTPDATLTIPLE